MALTGYSRFNGGAGCGGDLVMQLSPNYNFNQEAYDKWYAGLTAHEFFHVYYNHFMWKIPGGFWAEGSADFSARHSLGEDIRRDRFWMIEWTFNEYAKKYNIELDLAHISTNPNQELDIYYLGDMFFEYLYQYHGGYEKIIKFFNQGMDYSIFNSTYEEIDIGYINYLKSFISTNAVVQSFNESEFNIFPNPVSYNSIVSFKMNRIDNVSLTVCNLAGQKIHTYVNGNLSPGLYKFQIEKSKLAPGLYVVSLTTPVSQSNIKLIVND